jgi:hypothetical protein
MFHAGAVTPSSTFLLQLLTALGGDLGIPLEVLEELEPPVRAGLSVLSAGGGGRLDIGLNVLEPLAVLFVLGPLRGPKPGEASEPAVENFPAPVSAGLSGPPAPPRLGPIVIGKLDGFTELATRLKAPKHCKTCVGSLDSKRSTVRNRSCEGMLKGGCSHARRKCEMFSICMKGICDFLNLTPGFGTARFASLGYC